MLYIIRELVLQVPSSPTLRIISFAEFGAGGVLATKSTLTQPTYRSGRMILYTIVRFSLQLIVRNRLIANVSDPRRFPVRFVIDLPEVTCRCPPRFKRIFPSHR